MKRREQLEKAKKLYNQARDLVQQSKFNEAIKKLEDARSIFKNSGMTRRVADIDAFVGFLMSSQGTHGEALERFEAAKTIYERLEKSEPVENSELKTQVADLKLKIGNELLVLGQPTKALEHYKAAKAILERLTVPHHMIASAIVNIGLAWRDLGQLTKAITQYRNAKNIYRNLSMYPEFAITESRIGADLANLRKPNEALRHYEVAKRIFAREMLKMAKEAAGTEMNIGLAWRDLGQLTKAIEHYENAKTFFEMVKEPKGVALVENNIAVSLIDLRKPEEAIGHLEVAKNIHRNLKMPHSAAENDINMAKALVALRKPKEALKKCENALSVFQDLGLIMGQGKAYRSMGVAKMALDDLESASHDLDSSLELMELVRMGVSSPELQRSFKEEYLVVLEALCDVNLMLWKKKGGSKRLNEALNYMELAKCSTVAESLGADSEMVPCPEVEKLIIKQNQLLDKAKQNYRKMEDLAKLRMYGKITPVELKDSIIDWEKEYNALHKEVENLRSEILVNCADFGNTPIPRTYNVLDRTLKVFPKACMQDTRWCILEFAISSVSDKFFVFLIDQDGTIQCVINDVDLEEVKNLALQCQGVFNEVRNRNWEEANEELGILSKKLYITLIPEEIGEALKRKDAEHLIVVPHKFLHWVPFEALDDGISYWGLKYAISTDFSLDLARLCVEKRKKGTAEFEESPSFLLVKNPLKDREGMDKEVDSLVNLLKAHRIQFNVLEHQNAKKKAFIEAANERPFSVLFHAGHASFMGRHPSLSPLYLHTDGECLACRKKAKHHTYDLLLASEIIHRVKFKGTPIVYLSACESGVAEVEPGDEMFGLVRALMYAGATSLVLSRWLVEDNVGPIFVEKFYRQLLEGKKSVAVALRNARQMVFNDDPLKFTDWAVFSVKGDPFRRLA